MASNDPDDPRSFPNAEAAYAEFLRRRGTAEEVDFESFCAKLPELGDALRIFHSLQKKSEERSTRPLEGSPTRSNRDSEDPQETDPHRGEVPSFIGKYWIVGPIGAGGQAGVFRAVHPTLEKELVIKWSHRKAREDPAFRQGLLAEGKVLAALEHPNLARIYDLDFHEDRPFLVLEFVRGRNLAQVAREEPLSPRRAASIVASVARAVGAAHRRGVVHRDLKPGNIVMDQEGRPRVIDFGLARLRDAWGEKSEEPGRISGTIEYMAPEQARGETEGLGPRTDIFALGGVLYFLLLGHAPFHGPDWREALKRAERCDFDRAELRGRGVPRMLEKICLKAMEADPGDRFGRAEELAEKLESYLRRLRVLLTSAAVVALVLLLGFVFFHWRPGALVPPGPKLQAGELIHLEVWRGDQDFLLKDALPLRTGDELRIRSELPPGLEAALFWFDTEGKLWELLPVEASTSGSRVTLTYPGEKKAVRLAGPPGTELLLLCARPSGAPTRVDLEGLFTQGKAWPELPRDGFLNFGKGGVELIGSRKPGRISERAETAMGKAESLTRKLSGRFEWFAGIGFPHGE